MRMKWKKTAGVKEIVNDDADSDKNTAQAVADPYTNIIRDDMNGKQEEILFYIQRFSNFVTFQPLWSEVFIKLKCVMTAVCLDLYCSLND